MIEAYDKIPLLPQRKAAPTPVVPIARVDRERAERIELGEAAEEILARRAEQQALAEARRPLFSFIFYTLLFQSPTATREWARQQACEIYGVTLDQIISKSHMRSTKPIAMARRAIIGVMYSLFPVRPLSRIARDAGVKNHTTVVYHVKALGIFKDRGWNLGGKHSKKTSSKVRELRIAQKDRGDHREALGYRRRGTMPRMPPEAVLELRQIGSGVARGKREQLFREYGERFGLSSKRVKAIFYRQAWKHLPDNFKEAA
jgi:hypothetical protein